MKAQSFLKGAAVLTAAGLVSKLLGGLYRIPFFRAVGPEGMGLYQMAYPIYTMLLAVSSAGIPVAVSKLISESLVYRDVREARRVFSVSLVFISIVSGAASIFLYKSAAYLAANVLHDIRAYYSIAAISPAVFFVGLMSVLRGYFQGFQEMTPTAWSQILEQFVRVGSVLIGAYMFLPRGVEYAAAAATFGAVTGGAAGFLLLAAMFVLRPYYGLATAGAASRIGYSLRGIPEILYRLIVLALPISLGGLVVPIMQTLDAVTVPVRLQLAGYSVSRSVELYGELTGGGSTLINLPTVLTISLAASLVPAVSGSLERRNFYEIRKQVETAVEITVLVCFPAAVGLAVLATPISDLLFKCPEAGRPLSYLAPAAVFLGLHQTTTGVLQGMGRTLLPVINLALGAAVKFVFNYSLTAIPQIGIVGAALGTVAGFGVSSLLSFIYIRYLTGWTPDWQNLLLKPLAAVTIMGVTVYLTYSQTTLSLGSALATVGSVMVGCAVYLMVLMLTGTFRSIGLPGLPGFGRRRIL